MPKNTLWIALILSFVTLGCGSGDTWDGNVKGTFTLRQKDAGLSTAPLISQTGSVKLSSGRMRFDANSPLPDCNLELYPGTGEGEYKLGDTSRAFMGDSNPGGDFHSGGNCRLALSPTSNEKIRAGIFDGSGEIKKGNVNIQIRMTAGDSTYPEYVLEFKGEKSWF